MSESENGRHTHRTERHRNARRNTGNTRGTIGTDRESHQNSRWRHAHRPGHIANSVGEPRIKRGRSGNARGNMRNDSGTTGNTPKSTVNGFGTCRSSLEFIESVHTKGLNARKRRGLSTVMRWRTSSFTPAARSFGTNIVSVLP